MKLDEFNALSDEEKAATLAAAEQTTKQLEDVTAERDSFKNENEALRTQATESAKELKATKELNFTLSRQINVGASKDNEETLHDFMKGMRT